LTRVFDTKIVVVVREDLAVWQKLNVTAFTVSGVAATVDGIVGENYVDATGNEYLPMIRQPILVFAATADQLKKVHERALGREVPIAIYTEDLFATGHDDDNRAAVRAVEAEKLDLVGIALRTDRRTADKITKGLSLHS
jgi:hypothetical protein